MSEYERKPPHHGRAYEVPETGSVYFEDDLAYLTAPRGSGLRQGVWYVGPPESGIAAQRDVIKEVMGDWLGKLVPWDFFCTWTFAKPSSVDGAMYMGRRHLDWIEKVAAVPIYAFVATEKGEIGGLVHLHALVGNAAHLRPWCGLKLAPDKWGLPCCLLHAWPCGYSRVFPYDPVLGAKHYVSKYVCGQLAEWELCGFPAQPQGALISAPVVRTKFRVSR